VTEAIAMTQLPTTRSRASHQPTGGPGVPGCARRPVPPGASWTRADTALRAAAAVEACP